MPGRGHTMFTTVVELRTPATGVKMKVLAVENRRGPEVCSTPHPSISYE